ncbi:hypothetical protein TPA0910_11400 [Streptomyces hygroscopicus subsp. sporocinereus]|uniref:Uncharacterized protein n=1 Tax=Streptomyces hygroscopicus TaxID=1912 RepID=A0ABQ3TTR1_STRHY|nr:hypothetical protein TPA0910_11400 [Streptomyces hygroscopicus]
MTLNEAAGRQPKRTAVVLPSPSPVMVTGAPPDMGPTLGYTPAGALITCTVSLPLLVT